jgi:hypothetical protein
VDTVGGKNVKASTEIHDLSPTLLLISRLFLQDRLKKDGTPFKQRTPSAYQLHVKVTFVCCQSWIQAHFETIGKLQIG